MVLDGSGMESGFGGWAEARYLVVLHFVCVVLIGLRCRTLRMLDV